MENIKNSILKQAETCLVTSLLYHDILKVFSENEQIISFFESVLKKKSFNGVTEPVLLMMSYYHYGVLKNYPEFSNLKSFFREFKGNYQKEDYLKLKEIVNDLWVSKNQEIENWILNEKLQTNEIGRCSIIYPAILSLGLEKINLIELGCSAGLILLMDLYSYHYFNEHKSFSIENNKPVLNCKTDNLSGIEKLFSRKTFITKRIGLDLNIPDLYDEQSVLMLKSALWDDIERKERLEQAIDLFKANHESLNLIKADYTVDLSEIIKSNTDKDSEIVFYSSVSTYQIPDDLYKNLMNNLKSLSEKLSRNVYFVEYESVRNKEHNKIISPEQSFHISIYKFPENSIKQFGKAHFHGKSLTVLQ